MKKKLLLWTIFLLSAMDFNIDSMGSNIMISPLRRPCDKKRSGYHEKIKLNRVKFKQWKHDVFLVSNAWDKELQAGSSTMKAFEAFDCNARKLRLFFIKNIILDWLSLSDRLLANNLLLRLQWVCEDIDYALVVNKCNVPKFPFM